MRGQNVGAARWCSLGARFCTLALGSLFLRGQKFKFEIWDEQRK
jgi:hypothetical protein